MVAAAAPAAGHGAGGLRVAVVSSGSRGDVQPLVLLARQLQQGGHTLQALVTANQVRFCTDRGVDARPAFADLREVWLSLGGAKIESEKDAVEAEKALAAWRKSNPEACVDPMAAIREFEPDVVVWTVDGSIPFQYEVESGVPAVEVRCFWPGDGAAEKAPIRPTFITVSPLVRAGMRAPGVSVEGAGSAELNGKYFEVAAGAGCFIHTDHSGARCWFVKGFKVWCLGDPSRGYSYVVKSANGAFPPETGWQIGDGHGKEPLPVVKRSAEKYEVPLHTRPEMHWTGAWLPGDDLQPSDIVKVELGGAMERVLAFLDSGPAPVAIGWGSMLAPGMTPAAMLSLALRALRVCKRRAVIMSGWAQLEDALNVSSSDGASSSAEAEALAELIKSTKEDCCFVTAAPHHWLLPRCSCTVHHGGAGTTQAALHAGCPVVITPIAFDQPCLAEVVGRLGVGVGFEKKLPSISAEELADAIVRAEIMAPAAEELGKRLRLEEGVAGAARVMDTFLREEVCSGKWRSQWLNVWRVPAEAAYASHMKRKGLAAVKHVFKLREGKADQTWIVENKSTGERFVQHNSADGSLRCYRLGSPDVLYEGRSSMRSSQYVQQLPFHASGTLQSGDPEKVFMEVNCGKLGRHTYTAAPFPYLRGYRVLNGNGAIEASAEANHSALNGMLK